MNRSARIAAALLLAASASPGPAAAAKRPAHAAASADDGPEILLSPIASAVQGQGVVIDAEITDKDGVFEPKLFFRAIGETKYLSIGMVPLGQGNLYRAEIPGISVTGPMEYFVEAYDGQGNGPSRSAPATRPHKLFVEAPNPLAGVPLPPMDPAPQETPRIAANASGARAPDILHVAVVSAASAKSVPIEASFAGPSGVFNPTLSYRRVGTPGFVSLNMAELPASGTVGRVPGAIASINGSGRFVAEIPGAITTGDVEYFIEALDSQGNGPSRSGDREHPHVIRIVDGSVTQADPDVVLVSCRDVPREGETVDVSKLGPCRRVPDGLPAGALTKYDLGELKLRYDNFPDALSLFQDAVAVAPSWPAAWFRLAQAAEAKHEWNTARDAYQRYLALAGKPLELPALLKRIASVEYELDLEARDQREAEARAQAEKKREAERARQREREEAEEDAAVQREMLLSSPSSWGFASITSESLNGAGARETLKSVDLSVRFKSESLPFLFFGLGVGAGLVGSVEDGSRSDPLLTLSPIVGLNVLAIPAPRRAHFSLLSPYLAYAPRIVATGQLHANGDRAFLSRLVAGNHFEFGNFSVEAFAGFGVGQNLALSSLGISLGRKLGSDR